MEKEKRISERLKASRLAGYVCTNIFASAANIRQRQKHEKKRREAWKFIATAAVASARAFIRTSAG